MRIQQESLRIVPKHGYEGSIPHTERAIFYVMLGFRNEATE